jgi:hypothetical protein
MANRLRPRILSAAGHYYFYVVATLLLLGGIVGIVMAHDMRLLYAERVTLPPLERELGFTCEQDRSRSGYGYVMTSVVAGGAFDRAGIRVGDRLYTDLHFFLYELDEARRGTRVQLVVTRERAMPCLWIDRNDLSMSHATQDDAVCSAADLYRFERWARDWYAKNSPPHPTSSWW